MLRSEEAAQSSQQKFFQAVNASGRNSVLKQNVCIIQDLGRRIEEDELE